MVLVFIEKWGALLLAFASFVVAVIALVKSSKAQKLQNKIGELELKIKQIELEKLNAEKAESSSTCVEARVIHIGKGKYKLKVWNSGKATVKNVTAEFDEDAQVFIFDRDKMPYDDLEPNKNFELSLTFLSDSSRKFKVTTMWEDASGEKHQKVQTLSI